MIPYLFLSLLIGIAAGAAITHDLIKQEIKTGIVRLGRRVYRVVHSTDVENVRNVKK